MGKARPAHCGVFRQGEQRRVDADIVPVAGIEELAPKSDDRALYPAITLPRVAVRKEVAVVPVIDLMSLPRLP
jgi:hypothetical protein